MIPVSTEAEFEVFIKPDVAAVEQSVVFHHGAGVDDTAESFAFFESEICRYRNDVLRFAPHHLY